MRLFAGFPLSPLAESRLSALRLRLADPGDGLRWTTPEQWHLTLRFFGDLEADQISALGGAVNRFHPPSPLLRMETLGHFPAKGILYAAIEPTAELTAFHAVLLEHLAPAIPPTISLPFHPHITLARSKGPSGLKFLRKLAAPALPAFGPPLQWAAGPVHLYQSVLGPQGSTYRILASQQTDPV